MFLIKICKPELLSDNGCKTSVTVLIKTEKFFLTLSYINFWKTSFGKLITILFVTMSGCHCSSSGFSDLILRDLLQYDIQCLYKVVHY